MQTYPFGETDQLLIRDYDERRSEAALTSIGSLANFALVRHDLTDETSLEMGRCVAARLRHQPELIRIALDNLDRWTRLNAGAPSRFDATRNGSGFWNARWRRFAAS